MAGCSISKSGGSCNSGWFWLERQQAIVKKKSLVLALKKSRERSKECHEHGSLAPNSGVSACVQPSPILYHRRLSPLVSRCLPWLILTQWLSHATDVDSNLRVQPRWQLTSSCCSVEFVDSSLRVLRQVLTYKTRPMTSLSRWRCLRGFALYQRMLFGRVAGLIDPNLGALCPALACSGTAVAGTKL